MKAKTSVGPQAEGNDPTDRARRRFLQNSTAATLVAMAAPNLLFGKPTPTAARVIKIRFVGPRTGALAHFGEGNDFLLSEIRKRVSMGLVVNGMIRNGEIIEKDSEPNSNRAAEIASGLIKSDRLNNNRRT